MSNLVLLEEFIWVQVVWVQIRRRNVFDRDFVSVRIEKKGTDSVLVGR